MSRRRSKDRERYWGGVIQDQAASGLTISAFCREQKVPAASFFSWRRKLADRQREDAGQGDEAGAKFVAIELPPGVAATTASCEVVLPDGCRVIVPAQLDANRLRDILAALQERSC